MREADAVDVEEGAVSVFSIVLATRVVIAESEVDGGTGEGFAELKSDEGNGFGREGGVVCCGCGGGERVEAAVELVGHEVAGDGDEEGVGLLLVLGVEAGMEQDGGRVDTFSAAGVLELREVGSLGGRGGRVEDGGPGGGGRGAEGGEFSGIVEGIEVDIGEEERGNGGDRKGGRLGVGGEGVEGKESEEWQEAKGLHGRGPRNRLAISCARS